MKRSCHLVILFSFVAGPFLHQPPTAQSARLPTGFVEDVMFSGLNLPTAIRFSGDGRIFVAEKSGLVKVFDSEGDQAPEIFADLRTNVFNFWDRGLLGLELDPNFPTTPYVYVLYSYDAAIGGTAPRWGTVGGTDDDCPTPPGPNDDGCLTSGRLSRLQASGNAMVGAEQVLVEDWCMQFTSHTVGSLAFGPDGALYASGGEGASYISVDYGQYGVPLNPCGDPPGGVGALMSPPTAEGGALRSQDLRTSGDPVGLNGTIIRVNPSTGAAMGNNPLAANPDPNAKRIIAYGLRNPFRFAFRPGTEEMWVGDVGWSDFEEINRIMDVNDGIVENFGWPCYEGHGRQGSYDAYNLSICENLYAQPGADTKPFFAYHHNDRIVQNENCAVGSSSVSGMAFEFNPGVGTYPSKYHDALFFADYARNCIWVMTKDMNGVPNPNAVENFVMTAASPVDIRFSPAGDLYYVDLLGGTVRRVRYAPTPPPLPQPWQSRDIGSVSVVGSAGYANGIFTVNAAGADIWNFSDAFHYVYQPMTGNGIVTARVTGLGNSSEWAKAGVMMRETLNPDAKHAMTIVSAANGVAFQRRTRTGGETTHSWGSASRVPRWVRIERSGDTFISSESGDGTNWIEIARESIGMAAQIYVGLPVTSHVETVLTTATIGDVSVTTPPTAPNQNPIGSIVSPSPSMTWKVGDVVDFTGSGTDTEDGTLPAGAFTWQLVMHHCPSNCHEHPIQTFTSTRSGTFTAPDHEYPSHLELKLTVQDSKGATDTRSLILQPQTATLSFQTSPPGLMVTVNNTNRSTPFTQTVLSNSSNMLSVSSPQTLNGIAYTFSSWSDGGAQSHPVSPTSNNTYSATFVANNPPVDTLPPVISNLTIADIDKTNGTVRWGTNEPSTSQVRFGTAPATLNSSRTNLSLLTEHSVRLTGLKKNTTYFIQVVAADAGGNSSSSSVQSFTTRP